MAHLVENLEALMACLEQALHLQMLVKYLVNYIPWEMMTFGSSPTAPRLALTRVQMLLWAVQ
ncbi:unnamed protein product, partial [Prorocentrum cordatum]